ncbi:UNVERIFIED_CONTAM: hypothetical protein PYX00_008275 [Menopon gallinae]|uniref:Protein AATF n=1 Tax=Menopon gallinae TaxID=328185 RepID=A0AAW2HML1_9NEOP
MAKKRDREVNLSDKFSSLIHAKPAFFDEDEEDLTKIDDIVPDEGNSDGSADELDLVQFRKLNIEFLDAEDSKYSGKRSSRVEQAKAFGSDSSDVEESTDENPNDRAPFGKDDESEIEDDEESIKSDSDGGPEPAESRSEAGKIPGLLNEEILQKSTEDIKKGTAIRNQLLIWDLLLECRMKFQKCLTSANQLPKFHKLRKFTALGGKDFEELLTTSQDSVKHLLNSFLNLQDALLKSNDDYKKCAHKHKISSDEEDCEEDTDKKRIKLSDLSNEIENRHREMETYRNETIQKWNDKTRIAHLNSKNFNAFEQSTLKQIEHVLLDKQRLIKRTQVKRSSYQILGQSDDENDESPPKKQIKIDDTEIAPVDCSEKKSDKKICKEIFDDDDFYHQLLSEYVRRKSCDVSDPIALSKQWIQLEKIRSKMKKKVDTRATKGRKISDGFMLVLRLNHTKPV